MASTLTVDNIVGATSSDKIHIPGHVVQVQETIHGSEEVYNNFVYNDLFSVNITPTSASSKILIFVNVNFGGVNNSYVSTRVLRGSTFINQPTETGTGEETHFGTTITNEYTTFNCSGQFLDSPSTTSQVTYKVQGSPKRAGSGNTLTVNRSNTS